MTKLWPFDDKKSSKSEKHMARHDAPLRGIQVRKKVASIWMKMSVGGFFGVWSSNPVSVFLNFHRKVVKSDLPQRKLPFFKVAWISMKLGPGGFFGV